MAPAPFSFAISRYIMEVASGEYIRCFATCGVQLLFAKGSYSLASLHTGTIVVFAGNTRQSCSSTRTRVSFTAALV